MEFFVDGVPPTLKEIAEQNPKLEKGGYFEPSECKSRSKVAFIIPHRSRELHLRALLFHLHPILQRQQIQYKIFVAQQVKTMLKHDTILFTAVTLKVVRQEFLSVHKEFYLRATQFRLVAFMRC